MKRKRYRYTGKERDEETGLYYHGARYYAPWLGRWTSADPEGYRVGVNLFRAFSDNPIVYVDPNGRRDVQTTVSTTANVEGSSTNDSEAENMCRLPPTVRFKPDLYFKYIQHPKQRTEFMITDTLSGRPETLEGASDNLKTMIDKAQAAGLFSVRHEFPTEWARFTSVKIDGTTTTAGLSLTLLPQNPSLGNLLTGNLINIEKPGVITDATHPPLTLYFDYNKLEELWIAISWGKDSTSNTPPHNPFLLLSLHVPVLIAQFFTVLSISARNILFPRSEMNNVM